MLFLGVDTSGRMPIIRDHGHTPQLKPEHLKMGRLILIVEHYGVAYSYLGPANILIAGGKGPCSEFNIEYQNGYFPAGIRDEFSTVQIIELGRH